MEGGNRNGGSRMKNKDKYSEKYNFVSAECDIHENFDTNEYLKIFV